MFWHSYVVLWCMKFCVDDTLVNQTAKTPKYRKIILFKICLLVLFTALVKYNIIRCIYLIRFLPF